MTQFHEGQDVEVSGIWFKPGETSREIGWRKAKIAAPPWPAKGRYRVQFPDGTCGVFDAEHIMAVEKYSDPKPTGKPRLDFVNHRGE